MAINRYIIFVPLASLMVSCSGLFINKSKHIDLAKEYQQECLKSMTDNNTDTIQLKRNRFCIKEDSNKFALGKIKNNKKLGIWYYYKKNGIEYECYLIQKRLKNDSIIVYKSSIVNYRKW